jgi:hypothetical protein
MNGVARKNRWRNGSPVGFNPSRSSPNQRNPFGRFETSASSYRWVIFVAGVRSARRARGVAGSEAGEIVTAIRMAMPADLSYRGCVTRVVRI